MGNEGITIFQNLGCKEKVSVIVKSDTDHQVLKVWFLETPSSFAQISESCPWLTYLVDLSADLPNTPHQELLQVATLSARPAILPNQAPRQEGWI